MPDDCIFCGIVAGKNTADTVHESSEAIFFRDISPKAPVHVVVATKKHIVSLAQAQDQDKKMLGEIMSDIAMVAEKLGLKDSGYRVITNVGADAGQDVKHLHFHILGGEPLGSLRC